MIEHPPGGVYSALFGSLRLRFGLHEQRSRLLGTVAPSIMYDQCKCHPSCLADICRDGNRLRDCPANDRFIPHREPIGHDCTGGVVTGALPPNTVAEIVVESPAVTTELGTTILAKLRVLVSAARDPK